MIRRKIKFAGNNYKTRLDVADYIKDAIFINNEINHLNVIAKKVAERFKDAKKPAIVCVGSRNHNFDIFGPVMYDTFIKAGVNEKYLYWFDGVTAFDVIPDIKEKEHDVTLAFDAEVLIDDRNDVLKIRLREDPVKPGAGVGKNIDAVGDFSVTLPIGFKRDVKHIVLNSDLWYEIKDIEFICTLFVRLFLREVKPFYNFLEESNKILEV